jgi:hypothetical protein
VQVACRGQIFGTDRIGRSGLRPATSWSFVADLTRRRSTLVRSFWDSGPQHRGRL